MFKTPQKFWQLFDLLTGFPCTQTHEFLICLWFVYTGGAAGGVTQLLMTAPLFTALVGEHGTLTVSKVRIALVSLLLSFEIGNQNYYPIK